jgi:ubiquinone/menaquinone biosynthesis C-methylase UbiE
MIKDFWEEKHKQEDIIYLSGVRGPMTLERLHVPNNLKGLKVLEVGVGLGHCTKYLHEHAGDLNCLDISEVALDRVKSFCTMKFLSTQLDQLPDNCYDIAISHLVAQHMNDVDLQEQLLHVIRSLNNKGTFAMQYCFPIDGGVPMESEPAEKSGTVYRPVERMYRIIEKANGTIAAGFINNLFPRYKMGHAVVHIQKKERIAS